LLGIGNSKIELENVSSKFSWYQPYNINKIKDEEEVILLFIL
jgi:hypothetical protein